MLRTSNEKSSIPSMMRWRLVAPLAALLGLAVAPGVARALPGDLATKFRVNDDDPMASIPSVEQRNADPIEFGYYLQDMIVRAERAFEEKNWARAVKYYEPLAKAVPDRAVTFSRLCASHAELGDVDSAVNACSNAVHLGGALVIDHFRFVNLALRKHELTARELSEVDASITHLRAYVAEREKAKARAAAPATEPGAAPSASAGSAKLGREELLRGFMERQAARALGKGEEKARPAAPKIDLAVETEVLACKVAARLRSAARIERCLRGVRGLNLHPAMLLPFEWAGALIRKDEERAAALLAEARKAGVPAATLAAMAEEHERALGSSGIHAFFERRGIVGVVGLLALTLLTLLAARLTTAVDRGKSAALPSAR